MTKRSIALSCALATMLFTGCGGGGSSSSSSTNYSSVTGNVIDPAISNASVTLVCSSRTYGPAITDANGKFTIGGISQSDLSSCKISATGGTDADGTELDDLTLVAPYNLVSTSTSGIYVTPFTTVISNHDNFSSDISSSDLDSIKNEVATFFGVNAADLLKDPTSDVSLGKAAKDITEIALMTESNGTKIGWIDIDAAGMEQSLGDYIDGTLTTKVNDATKMTTFKEERTQRQAAGSVEELLKVGIVSNTTDALKLAYKISDTNTSVITNLKYLSDQIAEANKNGANYKKVTSYHLRKALMDVNLTASFSLNDNNISVLDTAVDNILALDFNDTDSDSTNDFKSYIDSRDINISQINSLTLFNSKTYESIVGNDQDKRRAYYAYSDKSQIANISSLSANVYSDSVNDPINSNTANGLAKLGFYDEALEHIKDNVYTSANKQAAYRSLGILFIDLGQNAYASKSFSKEYALVKDTVIAKDATGQNLATSERNALIELGRYMAKTGYMNDDATQDIIGANTVIDYLVNFAQYTTAETSAYSNIVTAVNDLARDIYYYNNDLNTAKSVYEKSLNLLNTTSYFIFKMAVHGLVYDIDMTDIHARMNALSMGVYDNYYPVIREGFTGDINASLTAYEGLSSSYEDDALKNGYAAALFLAGQKDKLFELYAANTSYYEKTNSSGNYTYRDNLIKDSVLLKTNTIMPTATMIKIKGGNSELEDYLDRMHTYIKTWDLTKMTDSDKQKIFTEWSSGKPHLSYGYLSMAAMYKDIGKSDKANTLISEAITNTLALEATNYKLEGLLYIQTAVKELSLSVDLSNLYTELYNIASTSTSVHEIIKSANILSSSGDTTRGKTLVDRTLTLVPALSSGDKDNVEARLEALAGQYNDSNDFETSIANGYFQLGDKTTAKQMILDAYNSIKTLGTDGSSINTPTQYKYLISIVEAYASLNDIALARPIIEQIRTTLEKNNALVAAANALASFDAFSSSKVASIDSDGDNKPDFFDLGVTQAEIDASGLTLDEDIDNDGTIDTEDKLPYDNI